MLSLDLLSWCLDGTKSRYVKSKDRTILNSPSTSYRLGFDSLYTRRRRQIQLDMSCFHEVRISSTCLPLKTKLLWETSQPVPQYRPSLGPFCSFRYSRILSATVLENIRTRMVPRHWTSSGKGYTSIFWQLQKTSNCCRQNKGRYSAWAPSFGQCYYHLVLLQYQQLRHFL